MRRALSILTVLILILVGFGVITTFDIVTEEAEGVTYMIETDITQNKSWDGPNTYVINVSINIQTGITLTINPGAIVKFNGGGRTLTISSGGKLKAEGHPSNKITFDSNETPTRVGKIYVANGGIAEFDHCKFENLSDGIWINDNLWGVSIANSSFKNNNKNFELTDSKVNVTSSRFEGMQFEFDLNGNRNKLTINDDDTSEFFIEYFVDINTYNGTPVPLGGITVQIQDQSNPPLFRNYNNVGLTNDQGEFYNSRAAAIMINQTSKMKNFGYNTKIEVSDQWNGVTGREVIGMSLQDISITDATNESKDANLHISKSFTFKYSPMINPDFFLTPKIVVYEDTPEQVGFTFHDNDNFWDGGENSTGVFDSVRINITYQNDTKGLYGENGKDKWIKWNNKSEELEFYRTIESPWTPSSTGPEAYKGVFLEIINITLIDPQGQRNWTGPVTVEFHNVPDKPEVDGINTIDPYVVTEDVMKPIAITVTDDDNLTADIDITADEPEYSEYVTYNKIGKRLELDFPNEFGEDNKLETINITATDNCLDLNDNLNTAPYKFSIQFKQSPDDPIILGTLQDKLGTETDWLPDLTLSGNWSDPDPDDDEDTLKWSVTNWDDTYFKVDNPKVPVNSPLSFEWIHGDLGGARNPVTFEDEITIWLEDKDNRKDSRDISLIIKSTNEQPSLHKTTVGGFFVTVTPEGGDTDDTFEFKIEYRDKDGETGDAPEYVNVIIDNISYPMTPGEANDPDYTDGRIYNYSTKLMAGEHEYHFECSDTQMTARLPDTGEETLEVVDKFYIKEFKSSDQYITARIMFSGPDGSAKVESTSDPGATYGADEGDINTFFIIRPSNMYTINFIEVTVDLGEEFANFIEAKELSKLNMELAYVENNIWETIGSTYNNYELLGNLTYESVIERILNIDNTPVITVISTLDADDDGVMNEPDDFEYDPAASVDTDGDKSPDKWNDGKTKADSTSVPKLHQDKFPDDIAASVDDDNDGCPDEWNPDMTEADSTSVPELYLDEFIGNPGECRDTDKDGEGDSQDTDDDNDNLPDEWEIYWNEKAEPNNWTLFDPLDPSDAKKDFDGDGRNNLEEFRKDSNPYEKDKKDEEDGLFTGENTIMMMVIIIIIIIVVFMVLVLIKLRGKKEPGEEQPEIEAESGERTEPPAEAMPTEVPPPETMYDDTAQEPMPEGVPPEEELLAPEMSAEEGIPMPGEEFVVEEPAPELTEPGFEPAPEMGEAPAEVPAEPAGEFETGAEAAGVPATEAPAEELQFSCPNCGTMITRDMSQCPGCQAPLMFD